MTTLINILFVHHFHLEVLLYVYAALCAYQSQLKVCVSGRLLIQLLFFQNFQLEVVLEVYTVLGAHHSQLKGSLEWTDYNIGNTA